ncbi:hypothetical protein [Anaerolinea sp.]|uniref:hypothetical protein n=1 Tax=Anaerolinea sp. TaxID=1872519 RepID=UPI002ACD659A|nr:hypothetical protein [Anaerolinea sp.]
MNKPAEKNLWKRIAQSKWLKFIKASVFISVALGSGLLAVYWFFPEYRDLVFLFWKQPEYFLILTFGITFLLMERKRR